MDSNRDEFDMLRSVEIIRDLRDAISDLNAFEIRCRVGHDSLEWRGEPVEE